MRNLVNMLDNQTRVVKIILACSIAPLRFLHSLDHRYRYDAHLQQSSLDRLIIIH